MSIHIRQSDVVQKAAEPSALDVLIDDFAKAGARNNKADSGLIQEIHDKCMKLADGLHCTGKDCDEVAKRGSRHSASDLAKIKDAHDIMCGLGARC